uniref:Multidrug and toxin extrusion protein n=1 Tax=Stegastes partitus TaxID=144197 RepID=A0A3B4ZWY4_9TELE
MSPGSTSLLSGSGHRLFCSRWLHRRVPATHREELLHILRMTGPLLLSRILNYLLPFVVTMFCGRLGNEVMAGYGLACATINVTTTATGYGLILACDTLVSQTFGGKNLLRVGVILQRGVIILLLFCLPCWGLLINAQVILLCVGQNPEVAMFLHHLQVSYLQNQGIILPQMYAAAMANVANVVTNYTFLYWLDLGVSGSAAANALAQIYISTFLFAFIWWKKLHVMTWRGWSVESLQEWGSFMKLAIPSTLMKCFEWWVYELGGFFAGMLSEDELAAQHAVIMVAFITYMFPLGIQAAACARVGNALGAGDSARAVLTAKVALTLAGSIAVVEGAVLSSTKTVIGFIFTSDEKIIGLVSHLMNAYLFALCHQKHGVCTGIFLGTGKQKIPAVANFIGYYCIGLSLSITLMFVAKLRVLGFWLGLLVCVILQSTLYIIVIFNLNWERMTEETASNGSSVDGYMSVSTECPDGSAEPRGGVQQLKGGGLSTTQLILRRGLTMFAAVSLLAVGATVHFLVPLPEIASANFTTDRINATNTPDSIFSTVLLPTEESE